MAEQKFTFKVYDYGVREKIRCLHHIDSARGNQVFFNQVKSHLPPHRPVELHPYPVNTSSPISINSLTPNVTHVFYESFEQRQANNHEELTIKPEIGGVDLYYISQEGENLTFEEFKKIFDDMLRIRGLKTFSPPPSNTQPEKSNLLELDPGSTNTTTTREKTFKDLVNELVIPNDAITSTKLTVDLAFKLNDLRTVLRSEGDSPENRIIIEKTKTLINATLQPGATTESSKDAIKKYQQEVSNLSVSQKVFIAAMAFLGALAGFIVGAVIGGVVSAGNPLAALATGLTTAVIVGASIGTATGGGLGLLLSRLGVFQHDPVKAAASEFIASVDDYRSATKSNNFS